MKKNFYVFIFFLISVCASAQTTQLSIGSSNANASFNDVKYDTLNGGIVKVGHSTASWCPHQQHLTIPPQTPASKILSRFLQLQ